MDYELFMQRERKFKQRLLLLKLRLKHKFTYLDFINLETINAEIKDLELSVYYCY